MTQPNQSEDIIDIIVITMKGGNYKAGNLSNLILGNIRPAAYKCD